jgi:hypothetical protein
MDEPKKTAPFPKPSEIAREGVLLWRLRKKGCADRWCFVFEIPGSLFLIVEDDPNGTAPPLLDERHLHTVALVRRSDALKAALLAAGWREIETG